jgi:hypothetical protein
MPSNRHHFVAQGYLRGFSCPKRGRQFVWVYDKRPGRAPVCKSVKSIPWLSQYYAQERDDGTVDSDRLEKGLNEVIETKAIELISRLDNDSDGSIELTDKQRALLATFIGISLTRVPSFRGGLRDLYSQIGQEYAEILSSQMWTGEGPAPEVIVEAPEWVTLDHMIESAGQIANSIFPKEWIFIRAPESVFFITSDNPVTWRGTAPANADSEVMMPLTKHLAIVCTPQAKGQRHREIDASRQQVKMLNARVARAARNWIFASEESEGLDRLAKKYRGYEQKFAVY